MDPASAIAAVANDIAQDPRCEPLASTATQLVMGSGDPTASIVLIGEAPGKTEDEQGIPFVGASGKFLDEMLQAAHLQRDAIYITNIVKYRPPGNRDPTPEEKRIFWPYLLQQLVIIKPRVIMTLGRHSGAAFIPQLVISRDHGIVRRVRFQEHEWQVAALYHPAAALYNGSMRQTLMDDFVRVVKEAGV